MVARESAMSDGKPVDPRLLPALSRRLADQLSRFTEEEQLALQAAFREAVQEAKELEILDLWGRRPAVVSYWVLLLSGVNQTDEMRIAQDLLTWQAFFAKQSAQVYCVQSSERTEFRLCSSSFDTTDCPVLVFSDEPNMKRHIRVDAQLLFALLSAEGAFQRFLTRLHASIENGRSLEELDKQLASEKFWKLLRVAYNEVKGLTKLGIDIKTV